MLWRAFALLAHGGDRLGLRPSRAGRAPAPLRHPDRVLRLLERLDEAAWTANALSAAAESGLLANLAQPATAADLAAGAGLPEAAAAALLDVMAGLGLVTRDGAAFVAAPGLKPFTQKAGADAFRAALRASLLQGEDFRRQVRRGTLALDGWRFEDADVIEAQGALTGLFAERAIPKLRFLPGLVPQTRGAGRHASRRRRGRGGPLDRALPALPEPCRRRPRAGAASGRRRRAPDPRGGAGGADRAPPRAGRGHRGRFGLRPCLFAADVPARRHHRGERGDALSRPAPRRLAPRRDSSPAREATSPPPSRGSRTCSGAATGAAARNSGATSRPPASARSSAPRDRARSASFAPASRSEVRSESEVLTAGRMPRRVHRSLFPTP